MAAIAILVAVVLFAADTPKKSTISYVQKNQAELEEYAAGFSIANGSYNGWDVSSWGNDMLEFTVGGSGFGSSTSYYGFYYSPIDVPLGFQGTDVDFVEDKDGWRWEEENGDNWNYTEKITDKWYWFEMHF